MDTGANKAQLTWVKGMESPNKSGRPRGTGNSSKRNLERLAAMILTVKEVKNNYDHMKPGVERWGMQKELMSFVYPKAQPTTLSQQEIEELHKLVEAKVISDVQAKKVG